MANNNNLSQPDDSDGALNLTESQESYHHSGFNGPMYNSQNSEINFHDFRDFSWSYNSNNKSNDSFYADENNPRHPGLVIGYCVGETVLAVIIVFGNLLVVLSFIRFRSLRRDNVNIFLFHLSLADLLVGLILPLHIVMFLFPQLFDSKYFCLLMFCSLTFTVGLSCLLLNLLAIHQLLSIHLPYRYNVWVRPMRLHMVVGVAYVYSAINAGMPLVGVNTYTPESKCDLVLVLPPGYLFVALVGHLVLLMISVCIMYAVLMRKALQILKLINSQAASLRHNVDHQHPRHSAVDVPIRLGSSEDNIHNQYQSLSVIPTFILNLPPSDESPSSRSISPHASEDAEAAAPTATAIGYSLSTLTFNNSEQNMLGTSAQRAPATQDSTERRTTRPSIMFFEFMRLNSSAPSRTSSRVDSSTASSLIARARDAKAIRSFVLLTICTVVCTLPFVIALPVEYWARHHWLPHELWRVRLFTLIAILLVIAHSSVNPIIYALRMEGFRLAFFAIFFRRRASLGNASLQG